MDISVIARAEKMEKPLCQLKETFYKDALNHIKELERQVESSQGIEAQLAVDTVISERRALKNLNDQRIKKLISAAVSDAYRDKPAHGLDPMLPDERAFYDNLVSSIKILRII